MFANALLLLLLVFTTSCAACTRDAAQKDTSQTTTSQHASTAQASETTTTAPATDFRHQFVVAAKAIGPAVVSITSVSTVDQRSLLEGTPFQFFFGTPDLERKSLRRGIGSGVIVDAKGHILTNNHVVADAQKVKVVLADNRELSAKVVGADPKSDLAVVKIDPDKEKLQPAVLGNSDSLQVGDWVMAVGSPFGLRQTVSAGIVSAVGRGNVGISEYEDFVQTDAAVNPGNSGGPLVDLGGRVVGINTAIASQSGGNNGVGFAIPIAMARVIMDQLIKTGKVVRGYVGLYIADVTEELAHSFGFKGSGGVLVQDVTPDSPAARAGIKAGDIVYERDGHPILNAAAFRNGIAASPPSTQVAFRIWRDGKDVTLNVKLGQLPGGQTGVGPTAPAEGQVRWGLGLSDATSELRKQLDLSDEKGAVVVRVKPDSPADDAGLRTGDLITNIGSHVVTNAADAQKQLESAKGPVRLRVVREGHGLFVIMTPGAEHPVP